MTSTRRPMGDLLIASPVSQGVWPRCGPPKQAGGRHVLSLLSILRRGGARAEAGGAAAGGRGGGDNMSSRQKRSGAELSVTH